MPIEMREKLSQFHVGSRLSLETRQKISQSLMGNQYARGFKHSKVCIRQFSHSLQGLPPENRYLRRSSFIIPK